MTCKPKLDKPSDQERAELLANTAVAAADAAGLAAALLVLCPADAAHVAQIGVLRVTPLAARQPAAASALVPAASPACGVSAVAARAVDIGDEDDENDDENATVITLLLMVMLIVVVLAVTMILLITAMAMSTIARRR